MRLQALDCCLLGLIEQGDCSGYDIRKILTMTPMRRFSDSPGSIYPALRRLERHRLVRASADPASRRGRTTYALTSRGRRTLHAWLAVAPDENALARGLDEVLLQLSFQHLLGDRFKPRRYLRALASAAETQASQLHAYIRTSTDGYPLSALLALRAGCDRYDAVARWARIAARQLTRTSHEPAQKRERR